MNGPCKQIGCGMCKLPDQTGTRGRASRACRRCGHYVCSRATLDVRDALSRPFVGGSP